MIKLLLFSLVFSFFCINSIPKMEEFDNTKVIKNNNSQLLKNRESEDILNFIIQKANCNNWKDLHFGELMCKIGFELVGTPYVAFTLEKEPEQCIVNLKGLDCVTFFENVLGIAKMIKDDKTTINDLIENVTFTRYRGGSLIDYTSRLHYTADWIYDNQKKNVINDITKSLGGIEFPLKVSFMSSNPNKYPALTNNSEFIAKMTDIENQINNRKYYYIPKKYIKRIEKKLKSGDIIAIATNIKGLDYSHIGIVFKDSLGIARLMHASSTQKMVVIDTTISEYLKPLKKNIGITVLRAKND